MKRSLVTAIKDTVMAKVFPLFDEPLQHALINSYLRPVSPNRMLLLMIRLTELNYYTAEEIYDFLYIVLPVLIVLFIGRKQIDEIDEPYEF